MLVKPKITTPVTTRKAGKKVNNESKIRPVNVPAKSAKKSLISQLRPAIQP